MKKLPFVLASLILLSFWTSTQGSLQTSRQVKSFGNIEYSMQSPMIKHYTLNVYGFFDTTPYTYADLYDMTEADTAAHVVAGLAQAKALKSSFKALFYWNARTCETRFSYYTTVKNNGWLLKDSGGNYIYDGIGYAVDIGNPAFQTFMANTLKTAIDNVNYDGVFADNCLGWGKLEVWYGFPAEPINPRTGLIWTDAELRAALVGLHVAIKSAIGSKLLLCNGIFMGRRFYDHQSAYEEILSASPLDGFMSEGAWYPYYDNPQWMSEQVWEQAVQFLIWVQDNWLSGHPNRFYVPVCRLAILDRELSLLPSGCTREQMATFAFTSMLLGVKTDQNYFSTFSNSAFNLQMKQLYDAQFQVGAPQGDVYMIDGTHVRARDFANGKVLVNPTTQTYTVNGQVIHPHTGVILLK